MKGLKVILASLFVFVIIFSIQAKTIKVPSEYPNIQAGIDASVDGDTVMVANGTYRGTGNKDLDLKGKSIIVKSENGAKSTIIDCEGIGRGFYFHSGETLRSVVSGFTIKNGSPGGNLVQIALNQTGEKVVNTEVRKDTYRSSNDNDPAVEPGEIMGLDIMLKNSSLNSIDSIKATLRTADRRVTGLIPIYTGTMIASWSKVDMAEAGIPINYGAIGGNSIRSMFFQFVKINEDFTPLGDKVKFILDIQSGNSRVGSDEFYIRIGADIVVDDIKVDDNLKPGSTPEDIDIRLKNITQSTIPNVRVKLSSRTRAVRITNDRVDFTEILGGRTKTPVFEVAIDTGFSGFADFTVDIESDRKLVNTKSFQYYFGMRTNYMAFWINDDGNHNGIAEPGESVDFQIIRLNLTSQEAKNVETTLSTADAALVNIIRPVGDYRNIPASQLKESRRDYEIKVGNADAFANMTNFSKQGYAIQFNLSTKEDGEIVGTESLTMRIGGMLRHLMPAGYDELVASISDRKALGTDNNGNGIPEPGEVVEISITLINISSVNIDAVEARLDSKDDVRFIADYGEYGSIRKLGKIGSSKYLLKIDEKFQGSKINLELDIKGKIGTTKESFGKDKFTIPVQMRSGSGIPEVPASIVTGPTQSAISQVAGYGGAIVCVNSSSPTIGNNIISNNMAVNNGGGIYCGDSSAPAIVNNLINKNSAGTYGGGIGCNNSSFPILVNNTIVSNSAGTYGAGIACYNSSFPKAVNNILWGNGTSEIYADSKSAIEITYSDISGGWVGTGNINANPRFLNAVNNDYHLTDDSPCIAAGIVAQNMPDKDMDGNPRPNPTGTKPDMGAYESSLPVLPLTVTDISPSSVNQGVTGKEVTVTGTGFKNGGAVSFSGFGITVKSTTFVDSTMLTSKIDVSTNAPVGAQNVIVTNPDGQRAIKDNIFRINAVEAVVVSVSAPQTVAKGANFTAQINIQKVSDLAGFQLDISFNPAVLEAVKVDEGSFLKGTGSTYWLPSSLDNVKGKITKIIATRTTQGGVSGDGIIASITFKAKTSGTSQAKLENVSLSDSVGKTIPVNLTDASVNVTGNPPWDVNKDGKVDIADLVLVAQNIGKTITTPIEPNPDVNGDGLVDIFDLVAIAQHFGETYGAAAPTRDLWKVDPAYLPAITKAYNMLESSGNNDPQFLNAKMLLQKLISSVKVSKSEVFQNYPNPFNPETWIPFQLSEGSDVTIRIYNSTGTLVKVLDLGFRNAGYYVSKADSVKWNGMDETGNKVASGVYFYTIRAGEYTATRKMLMVQ